MCGAVNGLIRASIVQSGSAHALPPLSRGEVDNGLTATDHISSAFAQRAILPIVAIGLVGGAELRKITGQQV